MFCICFAFSVHPSNTVPMLGIVRDPSGWNFNRLPPSLRRPARSGGMGRRGYKRLRPLNPRTAERLGACCELLAELKFDIPRMYVLYKSKLEHAPKCLPKYSPLLSWGWQSIMGLSVRAWVRERAIWPDHITSHYTGITSRHVT